MFRIVEVQLARASTAAKARSEVQQQAESDGEPQMALYSESVYLETTSS